MSSTYTVGNILLFAGINLPYATLIALMIQDQYERSVLAAGGTLFIKFCMVPVVRFFNGKSSLTKVSDFSDQAILTNV